MKKVELLAPVRDVRSLQTVIENGADSIYMGYQRFNARMFGENFNELEMRDSIKYAHANNVKVYLTLNTLIRDDEIGLARQMVFQAIRDHVDGILIQDIGLAAEIQKKTRSVKLHASTQMSVSNHYGVQVLYEMGFSRVVLARELNHMEICEIKQGCLKSQNMKEMEIEAFIHGGLCIAYSGQCLSSSYCYSSVANRGKCLMTCWKAYELSSNGNVIECGSLLRPRDLEGVYVLKYLMDGQIDCLKIQGRLRSNDYIGEVVNIYRHAIDDIAEKREDENSKNAYNKRLLKVSPRGLTEGNLASGNSGNLIMHTDISLQTKENKRAERKKFFGKPQKKEIAVFLREIKYNFNYLSLRKEIDFLYIPYKKFLQIELENIIHNLCERYPVYIYMPPMIYEKNCEKAYHKVDKIIKKYRIRGLVLSNISDLILIKRYKNIELKYVSGNHLHIYNHLTADKLMEMGVGLGTYSLELPFSDYINLKKNTNLPMQQIVFGHPDLMHMKYCLISHRTECNNCGQCDEKKWELNGENDFLIRFDKNQTETILYSKKIYSVNTAKVVGDSLRFDFLDESISEINTIIEETLDGWFYKGSGYVNEILEGKKNDESEN